jgi:hypothetical protein
MKIIGTVTLNEDFEWKPQQLLAMIREIEKICPEEGLPNNNENNTLTQGANSNLNNG